MRINQRKILLNTFPIITNIKSYGTDSSLWLQDIIAGVTVGLTLIPQSIAYAALAGLGPQYGLYSSLVGGIIYMIFGTIPQLNIAPTALLSLLTFSYTHDSKFGKENAAILLCFLSGIIELLCGLLHLGFLIDFVSTPVVAGFTSAAATTIAFSQLKNLLGLEFRAETMIDIVTNILAQIGNTKFWDTTLGICCCMFLLGLRKLKKNGASPQETAQSSSIKTSVWFISVSRNALVIIICAALTLTLAKYQIEPFSLTSEVKAGFPAISTHPIFYNNGTHTSIDIISELGSGVLVLPLVAILSNIAIAKSFSNKNNVVNASQEMIAMGLCNMIGAFVGSMPVNGSFSRGAVSNASGVRTPINGLYTGILVILALTFLTPYFSLIPKATLAAVIVTAVIFMVEINICRSVWKINKLDFIPLAITFLACLLSGIEIGILSGIVVNITTLLYFAARPRVTLRSIRDSPAVVTVKIESSMLLYPSAHYILAELSKINNKLLGKDIILDCDSISVMDFTAVKCLVTFATDFISKNRKLVIYNLKANLKETLLRASDKFLIVNSKEELDIFIATQNEHARSSNKDAKPEIMETSHVNRSYIKDNNDDKINGTENTLV